MLEAKPSRTAMLVARRRAAHQLFDTPLVLTDPIAVPIIGVKAETELREAERKQRHLYYRYSRAWMVVRSRFAEDELARCIVRGVKQYVVLGAGLDTFAYRNPCPPETLRVFEVDYPATQAWKRRKLIAGNIPIPPSVTYAAVDFERQTLADGLADAGFDPTVPTFFSWLGVTMYLTEDAIDSTLAFIASLPKGSGVVFDYGVPLASLSWSMRLLRAFIARRLAKVGEPFLSYFDPGPLREKLERCGFTSVNDPGGAALNDLYFKGRADGLKVKSDAVRLVSAEVWPAEGSPRSGGMALCASGGKASIR